MDTSCNLRCINRKHIIPSAYFSCIYKYVSVLRLFDNVCSIFFSLHFIFCLFIYFYDFFFVIFLSSQSKFCVCSRFFLSDLNFKDYFQKYLILYAYNLKFIYYNFSLFVFFFNSSLASFFSSYEWLYTSELFRVFFV